MVPDGWAEAKVKELPGANGRPVTKLGPFGSSLKKSDYAPSGYKVYGQQQVLANDENYGDYWIGEDKFKQLRACEVVPGDILLSTMGSFGSALRLTDQCAPGIINPRLLRLSISPKVACPQFLEAFFKSSLAERQFISFAQGGTMPAVNGASIGGLKIPLPPLPEQRKIADILSTWDAAIEKTEALLATAKAQKRALMQSLLTGKRRFPAFEGQPWKEVRLGDVVKLSKKRLDPRKPHNALPCIELEHIEAESGRLLGSVRSGELKSIKAKFHPGDVLFGKLRPYLRKYLAPDFEGVCSTEIWVLCADTKHLRSDFLHCIVQSDGFITEAEKSAGSKMPRSDWKVVAEYVLALPSIDEQAKIAEAISVCDKETDDLSENITKLRTEKKALMQQLLTGKRRVTVEEHHGV